MGIGSKPIALMFLLFCFVQSSKQQAILELNKTESIYVSGPLTKVACSVTFPEGSSQQTIIWQLNGHQLAVNGKWTADVIYSTINVQYDVLSIQERAYYSILKISNALHSYKGNYSCIAKYYMGRIRHINIDTIFVPISKYLPPPDFPKCYVSLSVVSDGDDVTFTCLPGDSNPPMDLRLVLQGPKGSNTYLGNLPEITAAMTLRYNNSCFVCQMTSTAFAVMRQCSREPIVVTAATRSLQNADQNKVSHVTTETVPPSIKDLENLRSIENQQVMTTSMTLATSPQIERMDRRTFILLMVLLVLCYMIIYTSYRIYHKIPLFIIIMVSLLLVFIIYLSYKIYPAIPKWIEEP